MNHYNSVMNAKLQEKEAADTNLDRGSNHYKEKRNASMMETMFPNGLRDIDSASMREQVAALYKDKDPKVIDHNLMSIAEEVDALQSHYKNQDPTDSMNKMFPTGKVEFDYPTIDQEFAALEDYYKKVNGVGQEITEEKLDEYELLQQYLEKVYPKAQAELDELEADNYDREPNYSQDQRDAFEAAQKREPQFNDKFSEE